MDENFWKAMAASVIRKAMMSFATYLVTAGLITSSDSSNFVNIASGIVIGGGALAWDWWKNKGHAALQAKVDQMRPADVVQAKRPA